MKLTIDSTENPINKSDIKAIAEFWGDLAGFVLWTCYKRGKDPRIATLEHALAAQTEEGEQ